MKKHCTSLLSLAAGALFLFTTACTTSRVSQHVSSEQKNSVTQLMPVGESTTEAVAAAQTSVTDEQQSFSAAQTYTQATQATRQPSEELSAANTQDSKAVFRTLREQVKQQKMGAVKKAVVTTALKKMEKMQTKLDVKAAKKGNAIPSEYRTPVIIGVVGLALLLIGAFGIWPLYVLGGIALTIALIWILLIALEVI